jgi:hypothetical protein
VSDVLVFNHIEKTAGSTMRHVLFRAVGGDRLFFSYTPRAHVQRIEEIYRELDRPLRGRYAVAAHTGYGVRDRLPPRHDYSEFTVLRDPVERTVSRYFYGHDIQRRGLGGGLAADVSIEAWLDENVLHSYNNQTAFLGGLWARHHLDGEEMRREHFDRELLERAKRNLESHEVVGLTERFDETLLLLRDAYDWPMVRTLYRPVNRGGKRRSAPALSERELEAVRASNALDIELYEHARQLFESRLAERVPDHARRLKRFKRANQLYDRAHPVVYPPARAVVRSARRLRRPSPVP